MHAFGQFARAEGFGHVIQGTQFESQATRVTGGPSGQNNDGDRGGGGVAPQDFADAETVDVGQHQVEQDEIGAPVEHGSEGIAAIRRGHDLTAGSRQVELHEVGHVLFVIHTKNQGAHAGNDGGDEWRS